jgi:hypothetical protein
MQQALGCPVNICAIPFSAYYHCDDNHLFILNPPEADFLKATRFFVRS